MLIYNNGRHFFSSVMYKENAIFETSTKFYPTLSVPKESVGNLDKFFNIVAYLAGNYIRRMILLTICVQLLHLTVLFQKRVFIRRHLLQIYHDIKDYLEGKQNQNKYHADNRFRMTAQFNSVERSWIIRYLISNSKNIITTKSIHYILIVSVRQHTSYTSSITK